MRKANPFDKFLTNEQSEHAALAQWLNLQHKTLLWWHTPNEGRKTPFERYLCDRMGVKKGVSDFVIIRGNDKYTGLVIELKAPGVKAYKQDGTCYFPEQQQFIEKCREQRMYGAFCNGFDEARKLITNYLNNAV
jgi:hypothetical protein